MAFELIRSGQTLQKFKSAKRLGRLSLGVALTGLAGLLLLLGGCAGGLDGDPRDGKTHIQLSTWGSAQEIAVLRAVLSGFEKQRPDIRVDVIHIPENYYQKLHILVAGDMAPDVIFTNSLSFPIYARYGVFRDLKPYLERPGGLEEKDFYPAPLSALRWKGGVEGQAGNAPLLGALPRDVSNLVIFYNKTQFRQAGVPEPRAGWTWQDFMRSAQKLTVDANHDGTPERFGVSFYATPPLFWLPVVWSAGGDLFDEPMQTVTLDRPESLAGLRFIADLRNGAHVAPRQEEAGGAAMSQLFMQGKLAMMVSGRWSVPVLREQAAFDWDVVPFPKGPAGSKVGIDASGYGISAKSAHPEESYALIEYLLGSDAMGRYTESGLIVPARPDVAHSALFLSPGQKPLHGKAFLDVIAEGVPTRTPPRWNEFSETMNLALQPVWEGKQDAATAVSAIKPQLEKMLDVGGARP